MKHFVWIGLLLVWVSAALPSAADNDFPADEPPASLPANLSTDDVLAMMARLPAMEICAHGRPQVLCTAPYPQWAKRGAAARIAKAIADHAETREEAGDATVYAIRESGNELTVAGDGGKSHGPWQLSEEQARPEVARDPDKAIVVWLTLVRKSRVDCAKLPEDDRLAELASGSCGAGRELARRRARLRDKILAQ